MKILCKVVMMLLGLGVTLWAQSPAKSQSDPPAKKEAAETQEPKASGTEGFYKLSFTIYELEDGKRVNQREYTMIGKANGASASVKVATRVPVGETQIQYVDAGLEIRCSLKPPVSDKLTAECDVNITNFVVQDQSADASHKAAPSFPIFRTTHANTWAVLAPGKPTLISTIDDVSSKKRTQIEVTATKVD